MLPAGTLRLEKLRDVVIGAGAAQETVTAYAIWGLDVTPQFVLARKDHLVGYLFPGWVLVEERHQAAFPELSALAAQLTAAVSTAPIAAGTGQGHSRR